MAKASVHITRTKTVTRTKVKKSSNNSSLSSIRSKNAKAQKRCPTCGRFL